MKIIEKEIAEDINNDGRIHKLKCYEQKLKNDPISSFSVIYVPVENSIDELPDVLYVLLLNTDMDGHIRSKNCTFDTILVRSKNRIYVGKFNRVNDVVNDNLLKYCKYTKDKCDGMIAFCKESSKNNQIFYKFNPYFDIEVVSDDDEFISRVRSPI